MLTKSCIIYVYPVWQHTFVSPSAFSRRVVVSYWRKYVHEVLFNHLGGLSLPRKSVVRLTDRSNMTLDVYHGCKTTMQQQQQIIYVHPSATPFNTTPNSSNQINYQINYKFDIINSFSIITNILKSRVHKAPQIQSVNVFLSQNVPYSISPHIQ